MEKTIQRICEKVDSLQQKRILIAIDGSCTSGKTTLAAKLAERCDCNVFHMDDFFLRPEQRTPERLAQPGGNVDYERFRQEVLEPLQTGKPFSYRPYDCNTGSLKDPVKVLPKRINIIEGTYSCHPYFGDPYGLRVFLKVSDEVRKQRILLRPAFLHQRVFTQWIPMEQQYFACFAIEDSSDIIALPEADEAKMQLL